MSRIMSYRLLYSESYYNVVSIAPCFGFCCDFDHVIMIVIVIIRLIYFINIR